MLDTQQRAAIVTEAKTWLGTPYRGWSCIKGVGTDCGQILYGIFHGLGFIPAVDLPKDYSLQVSQHRASTEYIDLVDKFFRPITEAEVQPGDLVVYELGLAIAHAAIIVEWPRYIIHAEARHGVSGAHGTKSPLFKRAQRVFRTLKDEYADAQRGV
jgi:cell wall-associated NlpC family hydrolase